MNKKNESKTEAKKTEKKIRSKRTFFLYAEGKGFLYESNDGLPVFEPKGNSIIKFDQRKLANFAVKFFKGIKVADEITVFANIA